VLVEGPDREGPGVGSRKGTWPSLSLCFGGGRPCLAAAGGKEKTRKKKIVLSWPSYASIVYSDRPRSHGGQCGGDLGANGEGWGGVSGPGTWGLGGCVYRGWGRRKGPRGGRKGPGREEGAEARLHVDVDMVTESRRACACAVLAPDLGPTCVGRKDKRGNQGPAWGSFSHCRPWYALVLL